MSVEQIGGYLRLVLYSVDHGAIPLDDAERARIMGLRTSLQATRVWRGIAAKFVRYDDGWRSPPLETLRAATQAIGQQNRENVEQRWKKRKKENTTVIRPYYDRNTTVCNQDLIPKDLQDLDQDLKIFLDHKDLRSTPSQRIAVRHKTAKPAKREIDKSPAIMSFPTVGGSQDWILTESAYKQLQTDFPALDIADQCRRAHAWLIGNPDRRKTPRGMMRYLVAWMTRATDAPLPAPNGPTTYGKGQRTVDAVNRGIAEFLESKRK